MPWLRAWFAGCIPALILMGLEEVHPIFVLLCLILMIPSCTVPCYCCCQIANHNQGQDEKIRRVIAELQPQSTEFNIQYKTCYTDCCNRDNGQPGRNIVFAP